MPAVFVHGNPETAAVWDPLLAELVRAGASRDGLVCLSPPGFGAPLPDGFGATHGEYRDWLAGELEAFGEPADLVGHDVGGSHVVNVVLNRPDLVRSWATDVLGIYDPGYEWHELARRWQTPGIGEADVAARFGGTVEERTAMLAARGMSRQVWTEAFRAAYDDFCVRVDRDEDTVIDPYASESPAEFFAVMSEAFFELPDVVHAEYPAVYAQLFQFYRQDPRTRIGRRTERRALGAEY